MGTTLSKRFGVALLLSLLFVFTAGLVSAEAASWWGNVSIGTNASTNGAAVGLYIGGKSSPIVNASVGAFTANMYIVDTQCDNSSTYFLKVWGMNATAVSCRLAAVTNEKVNLSVSSLVSSGGACSYTSACSAGLKCCSSSAEVNDGSTSGSCASSCASGSSSSSSGGGGGGSSSSSSGGGGTPVAAKPAETTAPKEVAAGGTAEFSIAKSTDLLVSAVKITVAQGVSGAQVTVQETSKPSGASEPVPSADGKVQKYLSITTTVQATNIEKAAIGFKVPKSWFAENGLDASSTELLRYLTGSWQHLETSFLGSDGDDYVFEAESPGFSTFAVVAKNKLTAVQLLDLIRDFYAGRSSYTALALLDKVRAFYGGQ